MEIRKLNTLRGIAALIVVITHFSDATDWLDGSLGGRAGQYGVMLFFLLSGFLMSYLYFDRHFDKANVTRYALARVGRVIPLYLLVVFFSFGTRHVGLDISYDVSETSDLISHLLFLDGESVLWTIAPEIHFYILFIGFWFLASWRPGMVHLVVIAVLITLFLVNFPRPHGDVAGLPYDFHLFRSLPYFLVGMLFGMYYKTYKVPEYLKSSWFVGVLLLVPFLYPEFSPVASDAKRRMWLSYEVLLVMSAVFYCIVFLVPDGSRLLSNRLGDFIGKISYSLYLLHMPILWQVNKLEMSLELKLVVFVLLSTFVAYLSFRFIEKPLAKWIRSIMSRNERLEASQTARC
ncbi:acyltransferase [Pleionea sp. CnH1-48]|uniref:acyltransferase family protein n=1 Tax=Pleionea sp. CnH1-48 TaxID=2954494 RepID=UPI002097256B|nr:acyltransferase [Pleionea sp. CnH1-48]MCO7222712.1 acyltransferase [Pleionea sp. CnH1-48]